MRMRPYPTKIPLITQVVTNTIKKKSRCGNYPLNSHSSSCFGWKPVQQNSAPKQGSSLQLLFKVICFCGSHYQLSWWNLRKVMSFSSHRWHIKELSDLQHMYLLFASKLYSITSFGLVRESFLYHSCKSQGKKPTEESILKLIEINNHFLFHSDVVKHNQHLWILHNL